MYQRNEGKRSEPAVDSLHPPALPVAAREEAALESVALEIERAVEAALAVDARGHVRRRHGKLGAANAELSVRPYACHFVEHLLRQVITPTLTPRRRIARVGTTRE